jgi:hypothetical protein
MRKRNRHQEKARYETKVMVTGGDIKRQPCEICGAEPAECHHIDYNDPERVMWLCTLHHRQTHSSFGKPAPLDWMADIRAAVARIDAQRLELRRLAARSTPEDQAAKDS